MPIFTPQITAEFLNEHSAAEYFILDKAHQHDITRPISIMFKGDVLIKGNLNTSKTTLAATLEKLKAEAVPRLGGERVIFAMPITFKNRLIADQAEISLDTSSLVRQSSDVTDIHNKTDGFNLFSHNVHKHFAQHLFIQDDIVLLGQNMTKLTINNFNAHTSLPKRFKSIIFLEKPQSIAGVVIFNEQLNANTVNVAKFIDNSERDEIHFDKYFDLDQIFSNIFTFGENRIRTLEINGSVHFENDENEIKVLNGIALSKYLADVVRNDANHSFVEISGKKTFESDVNTESTTANLINNRINPGEWIKNAFRKQSTENAAEQIIGGFNWRIEKLVADNVDINKLNNIQVEPRSDGTSDIIFMDDDRSKVINIYSDLSFGNGVRINAQAELSSTQTRPCNIQPLFDETVHLTQTHLNNVNIGGNVKVLTSDSKSGYLTRRTLSNFFENAVLSNSDQDIRTNIVITGSSNQTFVLNRISVAQRDDEINGTSSTLINNVDVAELYIDAVTKTIVSIDGIVQPIIINGNKDFISTDVSCDQSAMISTADAVINTINSVNIVELNNSITSKQSHEIRINSGQKLLFLQSPIIEAMSIEPNHTINGIHVDNIFFVYSPRQNQHSPSLIFDRSETNPFVSNQIYSADSLEVNLINGMSLKYFIDNRVKLVDASGAAYFDRPQEVIGYLTFENLIIYGNESKVVQINNIDCDDIVLTKSSIEQHISGSKALSAESSLYLNKPFHTWSINDIELVPAYSKSINLNQNVTINDISIKYPYQLETKGGVVIREKLNDLAVDRATQDTANVASVHNTATNDTELEIQKSPKFNKLHYIDSTEDFRIKFNDSVELDSTNTAILHSSWFTVDSFYREEIVQKTNESTTNEISLCPIQYHVQPMQWYSRQLTVRRASALSRLLSVQLSTNYLLQIRTEFPPDPYYFDKCKFFHKNQKNKQHPISIVYLNYREIFTLPTAIVESMHVFIANSKVYMVLHLYNKGIYTYRQNSTNDWIVVDSIPIKLTEHSPIYNTKLLAWKTHKILVVARSAFETNFGSFAKLYLFDSEKETYDEFQTINGDFNIIGAVGVPHTQSDGTFSISHSDVYLVLGMQKKSFMKIYKASYIDSDTSGTNVTELENSVHFDLVENFFYDDPLESISIFSEYGRK